MAKKTREEWLERAVELMRPLLTPASIKLGKYTVATGPCSGRHTLGLCFNGCVATDGETRHIIIDISIGEPVEVLATLLHEMIHACLPDEVHHNGPFVVAMKAVGLTGKPTATKAGPELRDRLERIATRLGKYPHIPIPKVNKKTKKKRNREPYPKLRSAVVPAYWFQVRPALLEKYGVPDHMGKPMKVEQ